MRIIDADELLKGRTDHEMISTHLIFNAPTVDVLGEIRAEAEKVFCISVITNELRTPMEVKTEILQIIDKYRKEQTDGYNTKI